MHQTNFIHSTPLHSNPLSSPFIYPEPPQTHMNATVTGPPPHRHPINAFARTSTTLSLLRSGHAEVQSARALEGVLLVAQPATVLIVKPAVLAAVR